jgi:apolipoprotein D and lipocalin family protein
MKNRFLLIAAFASALLLGGCMGVPDGIAVVDHVEADKYLGKWYEIVRLDHRFERGLEKVTAAYSPRDDGGIKVINRGYDPAKKEWKEAVGKAYFVDPRHEDKTYNGKLKVSFYGPFYGAYNIIALDKPGYGYVMVCGPDKSYLWILSRTPQLPDNIKTELIAKARQLGFATDELITMKH